MRLLGWIVLVVLLSAAALAMPAQLCGGSFAKFVVLDGQGKEVSDVTIELVAELPYQDFEKFMAKKAISGSGGGLNLKLSAEDAEELLKLSVRMRRSTDHCNNPLKQQLNVTRVRNVEDFVRGREGTVEHFGFCASENDQTVILLRASASGYVTNYYLGQYLWGCGHSYSFVLNKAPKTRNQKFVKLASATA
jgi:hypothetical protein